VRKNGLRMSTPKANPKAKPAVRPQKLAPSSSIALEFLSHIWAALPNGFVFLAARTLDGRWIEKGFHVALGWHGIRQFIRDHDPGSHDLYYCPNPFRLRKRRADYALSTRLAWCDIDEADPDKFYPQPTILIETSPRRYQGIWKFTTVVKPARAEGVSRHLTNTYPGDRGGWSITKMLRLPGTVNHKRVYNLPTVKVLRNDERAISIWPKVQITKRHEAPTEEIDPTMFDADAVVQKYKAALPPNRRRLMEHTSVQGRDRSRIIFMIVVALHDVGASPNEIAAVVWRSPYFISKFGSHRGRLAEEICRILSKVRTIV
jgi:RepB DNA-primase from phage plasmid